MVDGEEKNIYTHFMMTDNDRNVRTLIVCFVLAVMVLVPMEMIWAERSLTENSRVLGETIRVPENVSRVEQSDSDEEVIEIILPNAEQIELAD